MTDKVVAFNTMDQPLVNTLCGIIQAQHEKRRLTKAQRILFDRIISKPSDNELTGYDC